METAIGKFCRYDCVGRKVVGVASWRWTIVVFDVTW